MTQLQDPNALFGTTAFPELADALDASAGPILHGWLCLVRQAVPAAQPLSDDELRDHIPVILRRMAEALRGGREHADDPLKSESPAQGITRFRQNYAVQDVMAEDRLLRQVIVREVEAGLGRRQRQEEQLALHAAVDEMLQQAVVAFVAEQHAKLRTAAEAELKYLSFLSHDLNNHLGTVTLNLHALRQQLAPAPAFADAVESLDDAQHAIHQTVHGMGRLLESERLRKAGVRRQASAVPLNELLSGVARQSAAAAERNGLQIAIDAAPGVVAQTDRELIGLVVHNLVGNAVKYSTRGTVRVGASCADGRCMITVADDGPGIAAEHVGRIFDAFHRGGGQLQPGVGLGLSIASQAAKLLGGTLAVESQVGVGSTFSLTLP